MVTGWGFRVWAVRVSGLWSRVYGSGLEIKGVGSKSFGFQVWSSGFRGFGFRAEPSKAKSAACESFGFQVLGLGFRALGLGKNLARPNRRIPSMAPHRASIGTEPGGSPSVDC